MTTSQKYQSAKRGGMEMAATGAAMNLARMDLGARSIRRIRGPTTTLAMIRPGRTVGERKGRETMTDFTPTTNQVRDAYVRAMRNAFIASAGEHREEFERWLKLERFSAWQAGSGTRVSDETAGIGADRDDWLDVPVATERPASNSRDDAWAHFVQLGGTSREAFNAALDTYTAHMEGEHA